MSQRQPKVAGRVGNASGLPIFPQSPIGYLWVTDNLQIAVSHRLPNHWWRLWQYAFFGFKYTRLQAK